MRCLYTKSLKPLQRHAAWVLGHTKERITRIDISSLVSRRAALACNTLREVLKQATSLHAKHHEDGNIQMLTFSTKAKKRFESRISSKCSTITQYNLYTRVKEWGKMCALHYRDPRGTCAPFLEIPGVRCPFHPSEY